MIEKIYTGIVFSDTTNNDQITAPFPFSQTKISFEPLIEEYETINGNIIRTVLGYTPNIETVLYNIYNKNNNPKLTTKDYDSFVALFAILDGIVGQNKFLYIKTNDSITSNSMITSTDLDDGKAYKCTLDPSSIDIVNFRKNLMSSGQHITLRFYGNKLEKLSTIYQGYGSGGYGQGGYGV